MRFDSSYQSELIQKELRSLKDGSYASEEALERLHLSYGRMSIGYQYPAADDIDGWRSMSQDSIAATLPYIETLKESYQPSIVTVDIAGVPVLDVRPRDWEDDGTVLVYTHGGAYTLMDAESMLGSVIPFAQESGRRIISIDYTTAPAFRWEQIIEQVVTVFRSLVENGYEWSQIGAYGDSAGGGLMAGAVLKMRDILLGAPAALILWSPWADITRTGLSHFALEGYDAMLEDASFLPNAAGAYADPKDQRNPYVSAVYGDFSEGYPPTLIQGGTRDMLFSGFIQLYQNIDTAGQSATLDLYDGMQHSFIGSWVDVPEAITARGKAIRFIDTLLR
jgi:epsilon-lactone hydrolase